MISYRSWYVSESINFAHSLSGENLRPQFKSHIIGSEMWSVPVIEFLVLISKRQISLLVTSTQQQAEDTSAICFVVVEGFTICSSPLVRFSKLLTEKYIESMQGSLDHRFWCLSSLVTTAISFYVGWARVNFYLSAFTWGSAVDTEDRFGRLD